MSCSASPHSVLPCALPVCTQWDKSGELNEAELVAALNKLGCQAKLEDLDSDGDGKISFDEFTVLATVLEKRSHVVFKQPPKSKCKDLNTSDEELISKAKEVCKTLVGKIRVDDTTLFKEFQKLDDDSDARLSKREMSKIIQKHVPSATMAQRQMMLFTIFDVADINRDDSISFDEFKAIMQA